MNILNMDATELAKCISAGDLTSLQVTEAYIAQLQTVNPALNCLIEDRFDLARKEAANIDQRIKAGEAEGKLLGVPVSVKDCFHVKGMKTTSGLIHRKNWVQNEDAEIISRIKQEGAIIIGKTNTPALCFCQETDNKLFGRTNNPWNTDKTPGGSSGGEGALMAVGGAAVGLGGDIGGSIRFPSHFNGIVGFKSGHTQVPAEGNYPAIIIEEQARMLGIGAMGKSVRDARLMNEIIAYGPPESADISEFIIDIPAKQPDLPLQPETEEHVIQLGRLLRNHFKTDHALPPYFAEAAVMWQEIMSMDGGKGVRGMLSDKDKPSLVIEYIKERLFHNSDIHYFLSWAIIGTGLFKPSAKRMQQIGEILKRGDEAIDHYFSHRIVILPVYHRTAPLHGQLYRDLFSIKKTGFKYIPYVAYANTWGLPSLTVPIAEDGEGMPLAVQLVSKVGNEEALFQLGEWLEQHTRGYKRCSLHDK